MVVGCYQRSVCLALAQLGPFVVDADSDCLSGWFRPDRSGSVLNSGKISSESNYLGIDALNKIIKQPLASQLGEKRLAKGSPFPFPFHGVAQSSAVLIVLTPVCAWLGGCVWVC